MQPADFLKLPSLEMQLRDIKCYMYNIDLSCKMRLQGTPALWCPENRSSVGNTPAYIKLARHTASSAEGRQMMKAWVLAASYVPGEKFE